MRDGDLVCWTQGLEYWVRIGGYWYRIEDDIKAYLEDKAMQEMIDDDDYREADVIDLENDYA